MTPLYEDLFHDVSWNSPNLTSIKQNEYRLDAPYYSQDAKTAKLALCPSGFVTKPVIELAKVFALSDFSLGRIPAEESRGMPFFTFSDILEWDPLPNVFLSRKYEPNLDDYIVKEGWVLISRAGSVGNVIKVGAQLNGQAVANHAIRIIPQDDDIGSLLFLVLSGPLGKTIVSSFMYGGVVDVIRPEQIEQIDIPIPPNPVLKELSSLVKKSIAAKNDSVTLLHEACDLVNSLSSLPDISKKMPAIGNDFLQPTTFGIHSRDVTQNADHRLDFRLDASYYNPIAQLAIANIRNCPYEIKTVGEVTIKILMGPRFKRNYVEASHGVPFLSGKNIIQVRPTELNHLSNLQMADMQELLVERGWTLITCSGTIGRTCFVWKNFENYAASQHILRVIPDESEIDPGYLYAFLSSRYGSEQILRYTHGSVIDEITDKQVEQILLPFPSEAAQQAIGDKVREAYNKRAEAIGLEDEAQAILMKTLANTL